MSFSFQCTRIFKIVIRDFRELQLGRKVTQGHGEKKNGEERERERNGVKKDEEQYKRAKVTLSYVIFTKETGALFFFLLHSRFGRHVVSPRMNPIFLSLACTRIVFLPKRPAAIHLLMLKLLCDILRTNVHQTL